MTRVLWSLAAITGVIILGGFFGMLGFLLGALAILIVMLATRKQTRKADPIRVFGGLCIIVGLAVILLTIPVVRSRNEREFNVSINMSRMGYVMPVREASPWPGFIGGAVVLGFGVLLLAIRRPREDSGVALTTASEPTAESKAAAQPAPKSDQERHRQMLEQFHAQRRGEK